MPELPDDVPDDLPDEVREWLEADYGVETWESATIHGNSDGYWSVEVFYDDGTSSTADLGYFEGEPDDWVWELYDWLDDEVGGDVDVDYNGE